MKIRKRAEQKNFRVSTYYYRQCDLVRLTDIEGIEYLNGTIVVYAEYVKDIKVVLDNYGFYTNVVDMITGQRVYIEL